MKDITLLDTLTGNASRVTIVVHTHPDGDALGSGTAMLGYLSAVKGKDAVLIVPDSIPDSLAFIARGFSTDSILVHEADPDKAAERIKGSDLLVCLDCNSFSRTAGMESLLRVRTQRYPLSKAPNPQITNTIC